MFAPVSDLMVTKMKNASFTGRGWVEVPEAKLLPNDQITGWQVKRDIVFFAFFAQVQIKVESSLAQVRLTHFVVSGSEEGVRLFHQILKRAIDLHNQPRFAHMQIPMVTWQMKISSRQNIRRRALAGRK